MLLIACESTLTAAKINKASTPNDSLAKDAASKSSAVKNEVQPFPKTTELKVGQSLVVVLTTTRGSDQIWRVQSPLPHFLELASETKQTTLGLGTGTAETQVFKFNAFRTGEENLSFLLGKRNQPGATTVEIRTTLVTVSAP